MTRPIGKYHSGAIPSNGLTVLFEPEQPSVDIVFVHGFTGHPEKTWTHKKGDTKSGHGDNAEPVEPPSKARKLNPFSRPNHDSEVTVPIYWPRDLIPETVASARVFTYGYDTHLRHTFGAPVSQSTVYDIAWDFLVALEAERQDKPTRSLIFVAHSLGGIVVKEALRRSRSCSTGHINLRSVFDSTAGIIFFGTPHGGSDPRGFLQHIAEAVIKAAGVRVNEQIASTLLPSSDRLRELRDEFAPMAQEQGWIIHSFQESLGIMGLNGKKVVDDTSSYLNYPLIETTQHIEQNHMNMCRFQSRDDVEYRKVAIVLIRIVKRLSEHEHTQNWLTLTKDQRYGLLNSLRFDQIDARQMNIKRAHAKTCQWLLEDPQFLDWLNYSRIQDNHGFLWIKGKPGTGKSTLMKFVLTHSRKAMRNKIVISFFFNARGTVLEKSTAGMYRSLLVQLLEQIPRIQTVFDTLGYTSWNIGRIQWSIESLKSLFGQAIEMLERSSVVCFIDALDECDEDQIRDMVTFFQDVADLAISASIRFQVCLSSRHYPQITMRNGLSLVLEGEAGHAQDITSYIQSNLHIGSNKLAEDLQVELQEKASGVFMWVVLVVDILNAEHDKGRMHGLRRRLRDIPADLHELFQEILARDTRNRQELLLCIQWVLFARRPLKPEELYFAVLSGIDFQNLSRWAPDEITMETIKSFILDCSKGLAEVTRSAHPTVQFIHESVRDFLLKENGLKVAWPDFKHNIEGSAHDQLKQCCLNYMTVELSPFLNLDHLDQPAPSAKSLALRKSANTLFPFLQYAGCNVLFHAERAQENDICQIDFLKTFLLADWIKINNLYERYQIRRYTPEASLLYILAETNSSNLLKEHAFSGSCFEIGQERYGTPIFAAMATGSDEAYQIMIKAEMQKLPQDSRSHQLWLLEADEKINPPKRPKGFVYSPQVGPLPTVLEYGDDTLLALILETQENIVTLSAKDTDSLPPLEIALNLGRFNACKLLLENGADPESRWQGQPLLNRCAAKGDDAMCRLLLDYGVDVNVKCGDGLTALYSAFQEGYEHICELLLDAGADPNAFDGDGQSLLAIASKDGPVAFWEKLLEKGAGLDYRDNAVLTAVVNAAKRGHEKNFKMLLEQGDNEGLTAVVNAAKRGHEKIFKMLLEKGAKLEIRDIYGNTALATVGNEHYCKILLEAGADVGTRNNKHQTPLHNAASRGSEDICKVLLDAGADLDAKDDEGQTPLAIAAHAGCDAVCEILIDCGANIESLSSQGQSPLSLAVVNDQESVTRLLLERGASTESENCQGKIPILHAIECYNSGIIRLFLNHSTSIEVTSLLVDMVLSSFYNASKGYPIEQRSSLTDTQRIEFRHDLGRTPLSYAAGRGEDTLVRLLLRIGADVDSKDDLGRTPLWWAVVHNRLECCRVLLDAGADKDCRDYARATLLSLAFSRGHHEIATLLQARGANPGG